MKKLQYAIILSGIILFGDLFGGATEAGDEAVESRAVPKTPVDVVNNIIKAVKEELRDELKSDFNKTLNDRINERVNLLLKLLTSGLAVSNLNFDLHVNAQEISPEIKTLLLKALGGI
jgi:hypothetical protein